jgi:uncharacterized repeat protein (TIGR03803 family)
VKLILLYRVVFLLLLLASFAGAAERQVLRGHVPIAAKKLTPLKRLEASKRLDLTIALPLRNTADLSKLLDEIYEPSSPNYHRYLTPEEFAKRFGPSEVDYAALINFANAHKLAIIDKHPNRTLLDVRGSVADIEKAFHINIRVFQHPHESRTFRAPDTEPSLDLDVPILSISGLDDFNLPKPMSLSFRKVLSRTDAKEMRGALGTPRNRDTQARSANSAEVGRGVSTAPLDAPMFYATGSGPRASFIGNDFRAAYAPGVILDGAGQAVGLFELDGYFASDITEYEKLAGLPNIPITNVLVGGYNGSAGNANMEVALDIEMVISMAPGLSQAIVYEGTSANAVLNRMATDDLAKQLSSSWGFGSQVDPAREQIFQQFAAQGQSMFQASGDNGAWTGAIFPPSDDAWVTVVGGTSLNTVTSGGSWQSETTWSGSGGGVSTSYPIPSWQQGISMTTNLGSTTMRNIPDVAAHSDENIWVIVNNGEEGTIGGTSAAAPLWTAFTALANQQAAARGQPGIGFLNPAIYALGQGPTYTANFHDITTGNNTNSSSANKFFAVPGYDLCTGWGTPIGSNLIAALAGPLNALTITPPADFFVSGPTGGPFAPAARTYTLTNSGSAPLNWSLANTSLWLNVSAPNGALLPGGPRTDLVLSLNPVASNLVAGNYSTSLLFTNQADQTVQSRSVTLIVTTPAFVSDAVLTTLYSFSGGNDGANPNGLILATNGFLYGTTQHGGTNDLGTIFRAKPGGAFTSLYSFAGDTNGAIPFSSLTEGPYGFYGTTIQGGDFDNGTVFRIGPHGGFRNLVSLNIDVGDLPFAGLTLGLDGYFYFACSQGGASGRGAIFKMFPTGLLTLHPTIFSFTGGASDGGFPHASLTLGVDGNLYGTTYKGGAFDLGTVFRITTNGNLNTLVSFNNTNGASSYAALARAEDGFLYGTTAFGGSSSNGTIFRFNASGQFTNVYSFTGGVGGAQPMAGLFLASDGNLYGTTANGGAFGFGTVFRMLPDGTITNLVHFDGFHGANPQAPLSDGPDGNLYGTTQYGGASGNGTIFQINFESAPQIVTPPISETVFAGSTVSMSVAVTGSRPLTYQWKEYGTNLVDGANIAGSTTRTLIFNGITTNNAGTYSVAVSNALGWAQSSDATLSVTTSPPIIVTQPTNVTLAPGGTAIFSVSVIGSEPLSYQWRSNGFNLANVGNLSGSTPSALNIPNATEGDDATYSVFITNSLGSVLSSNAMLTIIPASAPGTRLTTLYSFSGGISGNTPNGLALGTNGLLYGTTQLGPGNVFTVNTNGTVIAPLVSFGGTNGSLPRSGLVLASDGNFYGTTQTGGTSSEGTVFRLTHSGALTSLFSFTGDSNTGFPDGAEPYAPLVQGADGNLYGATTVEGGDGFGTVFKITPNGSFTTVYSFTNGTDGIGPTSGLIQALDGNFYGVTSGGSLARGNVFRMDTNGIVTNLYTFNGANNGGEPNALVQGTDGYFYGTTAHSTIGSLQFYGIILRMDAKGNLGPLYTLNFFDGHYPAAGLVQATDGNFYGTTHHGGAFGSGLGNGTIFRIAPNGAFATLASFDGFNGGAHPAAALLEGPDGNLYGTTTTGGWGGKGTVFRLGFTSAPQVITQPANQPLWPGATATFYVTVSGANPFSYQWRKNGNNLTDGGNVFGTTARILTLTNVTFGDVGTYSVVVSNALGNATSDGALLTILFPPQFQTATKSNTSLALTWTTVQGQRYQLQYKADLNAANWVNLGSQRTATNATITVSDPIGSNAQRFYRVIMLP